MKSNSVPAQPYASAEFQLSNPGLFFHFKVRQTEGDALFALIKKDSAALGSIKTGDVIPMTFHFPDKTVPAQRRPTRIKYIEDVSQKGVKDHVMVTLDTQIEFGPPLP